MGQIQGSMLWDQSPFSSGGLQMAAFRASGAHVPSARCAPGREKPPFSPRHLLNVDPSQGLWGFGVRHAASSVRHAERGSASMAGPSLLRRLSGEGGPCPPPSGPGQALKQVGTYALQASQALFPGEGRGPDDTALPHMDPGFRRGTVPCRKGIIARQGQGDGKEKPCRNPNPQQVLEHGMIRLNHSVLQIFFCFPHSPSRQVIPPDWRML